MTTCLPLAERARFAPDPAIDSLSLGHAARPREHAEMTQSAVFPLTMAPEGERVRIQTLRGGKGLVMRLTELGLNQGTEVRVVQRQGGGLVVARGETRIALGGGMAMKVLVTAVPS